MSVKAITSILNKALLGDFSVRIDTSGMSDELKELAESVNSAIEYVIDSKSTCDNVSMMIKQNPYPMILLDRNFMPVDVNDAYEAMVGRTKEKIFEMQASDYKTRLLSGDSTKTLFTARKRTKSIIEMHFNDGRIVVAEQSGVPLINSEGNVDLGLFVFKDITEQANEEEEIKKQLSKIKALQDRSEVIVQDNPMPILLGDKSFQIRVVNKAFVEISGIPKDRVLRMSLRDFDAKTLSGQGLKQVLETGERSVGVVSVTFPSGTKILEQYGIPIRNAKGEVTSILIVYNDITLVRAKEAEVEHMMRVAQERTAVLEESAKVVGEGLKRLNDADFTYSMTTFEGDPLASIKLDYNSAMQSLKTIIGDSVKGMANILVNMEDAARSSSGIATSAENVAVGTVNAADLSKSLQLQIESITRSISDLSASNEEIASTSQEVLNQAKGVSSMGKDAVGLGEEATGKMQSVVDITNESVEDMDKLNAQLGEINSVLKLITEITNQINMLALNAAIEAARAGEHGRGFAVVAGEVKNLANDARTATARIDTVVTGIQHTSTKTVSSIKSANQRVLSGVESVNAAVDSLNKIVKGAEQVTVNMSEITKAIEDQANITNNIVNDSEKSNSITIDTQKEIESLAGLSEETSASVQEINSAIQEVTKLSQDLSVAMKKFNI